MFRTILHQPMLLLLTVSGIWCCHSGCNCSIHVWNCSSLGVNEIPQNISTSVRRINLSENNITKVVSSGNQEAEIVELNLDYNNLKSLDGITDAFPMVTGLSIQGNNITFDGRYVGKPLLKVTDLNIGHNTVRSLKQVQELFPNNKKLSLLNTSISDETIKEFAKNNRSFKEVEDLDLDNNNLTTLKFVPWMFPSVNKLYIKYNKLQSFNVTEMSEMKRLEGLYLSHNNIQQSCNDPCIMSELRDVYFNENNTKLMVPNLKWLDLSWNQLNTIPTLDTCRDGNVLWFYGALQTLLLSHNCISELKDEFHGLQCLKYLDVSHNLIKSVNFIVFERLTALEYLNVAGNKLFSLTLVQDLPCSLKWINMKEMNPCLLATIPGESSVSEGRYTCTCNPNITSVRKLTYRSVWLCPDTESVGSGTEIPAVRLQWSSKLDVYVPDHSDGNILLEQNHQCFLTDKFVYNETTVYLYHNCSGTCQAKDLTMYNISLDIAALVQKSVEHSHLCRHKTEGSDAGHSKQEKLCYTPCKSPSFLKLSLTGLGVCLVAMAMPIALLFRCILVNVSRWKRSNPGSVELRDGCTLDHAETFENALRESSLYAEIQNTPTASERTL